MKGIWITWEKQRRNRGISDALNWRLYEIVYDNKPKLYRYLLSIVKTIGIIFHDKPQIVIAQNPSKVLAFIVICLKRVFRYTAVVDAHNSGIYPRGGRFKTLMMISKWLQQHADLTIVTNKELSLVVQANGGKPFILPDRIPSIPLVETVPLSGKLNILYICTFSEDEPYRQVLEAAELIPQDITIYFTGNNKGKIAEGSVPSNVELLGFVSESTFWSMIMSADIIMDITLREGCLVCGAYEGVAAGKPLILSDTEALRDYFNMGSIYVGPAPNEIANGILQAQHRMEHMKNEIQQLKKNLEQKWQEQLRQLQCLIGA